MKANRRIRSIGFRRRDDGQLMLLSGIIITLAFILTSLTLAQVSSLERQTASDRKTTLGAEWRFLHDRLATNFDVAISPDTTNSTFQNETFPTISATFRNIEAEKGFDVVMRLANASMTVNLTEGRAYGQGGLLVDNGTTGWKRYNAVDASGLRDFQQNYDGVDDGLLWRQPCDDPTASSAGCISGVLVYLYLSDGVNTLEEVILFAVNRGG